MGSWHDMAESAMLERYARGDASQDLVDAWPSLRPHLCQRLRDNVRAFPVHTEPHLHKAAPLADLLREARPARVVACDWHLPADETRKVAAIFRDNRVELVR